MITKKFATDFQSLLMGNASLFLPSTHATLTANETDFHFPDNYQTRQYFQFHIKQYTVRSSVTLNCNTFYPIYIQFHAAVSLLSQERFWESKSFLASVNRGCTTEQQRRKQVRQSFYDYYVTDKRTLSRNRELSLGWDNRRDICFHERRRIRKPLTSRQLARKNTCVMRLLHMRFLLKSCVGHAGAPG